MNPQKPNPVHENWRPAVSVEAAVETMIRNGMYKFRLQGRYQEIPTQAGLFVDFGTSEVFGLIRNYHEECHVDNS